MRKSVTKSKNNLPLYTKIKVPIRQTFTRHTTQKLSDFFYSVYILYVRKKFRFPVLTPTITWDNSSQSV